VTTREYKPGERVQYRYRGGEYVGNGPATVVEACTGPFFAATLRLDANGQELPAGADEIHPIDWQPTAESAAAETRGRMQAFVAQMIHETAQHALVAGMTRSEWDASCAFWFGQAAADYAHHVAAKALETTRGEA